MADWVEKGKSSTLGSARCWFKRLRRVETKVEKKRRWQRQATRGYQYWNDVFWILVFGNAVNVCLRCSVLNGKSADVPEDIVVDWSLRYPRSATARYQYTRKPFSVWTTLLCIAVCVCSGVHMLYRASEGLIVKSLADDHPPYTTTPMWFWGWSYKRGSTVHPFCLTLCKNSFQKWTCCYPFCAPISPSIIFSLM